MVADKFRPGDARQPETPKHVDVSDKGQDVLKAEKKDIKFTAHTIKSGETLSEICQQYGVPLKALYAVNQHTLDPKIIEKDGKIAYGAPTYHVGDKLNIPSDADVPNAVKYFDAWAKATVAKQRLEKPEVMAKPSQATLASPEKPRLGTQITDEEHLAAKRAAMMVKVTLETQHNKFRTLHEGQGSIDDAIDWFKDKTGLEHSSQSVEKEYEQERQMVKLLEKSAALPNLKQFENIYRQCTGKDFDAMDFSSQYKKPTALAFPDLSADYEQSQEGGRRIVRTTVAAGSAALMFVPGGFAVGTAARFAAATALGTGGGAAVESVNSGGRIDRIQSGATDGAIVGVSVAASIPIAGLTEAGLLAGGASVATKFAPTVRVMAGLGGGAAGGGSAGAILEAGLTTKDDASKGKFDPIHVAQKTGEGFVTGAVIGGPIGATGPLLKNVINIPKAASAEAATSAESEMAAATTAIEKPVVPSKTSAATETQPPPDVQKSTPSASGDAPTQTATDTSKGAAAQPGDIAKTTPDVPKDSSANWQKGSTHDMPASQKPDVSKYAADVKKPPDLTPEEMWNKRLDNLQKEPLVKPDSIKPLELQNGWQGVQYERKIGGRIVKESFNPKDGSRVFTEEFKDGMGTRHREVTTTSAGGKEITNKFRLRQGADGTEEWIPVSNKWENHLIDLRRSHPELEEIPMGNDWSKVRYEKNGQQIEEAARGSDGARYKKVEYTDHRGVPNREVSTTSAEGKTITNKFKLDQSGEWKFISKTGTGKPSEAISPEAPAGRPPDPRMQWAKEKLDAGANWAENKLKSLREDNPVTDAREVQLKQGWKAVEYTDASGAKITEAYNPTNGSKHTIRDYKENGARFQEDTLEVPSDGLKLWRKQKEFPKLSTGLEEETQAQFEWRTIDTKREVMSKNPPD